MPVTYPNIQNPTNSSLRSGTIFRTATTMGRWLATSLDPMMQCNTEAILLNLNKHKSYWSVLDKYGVLRSTQDLK
jgi:hypothetical protein